MVVSIPWLTTVTCDYGDIWILAPATLHYIETKALSIWKDNNPEDKKGQTYFCLQLQHLSACWTIIIISICPDWLHKASQSPCLSPQKILPSKKLDLNSTFMQERIQLIETLSLQVLWRSLQKEEETD